MKLMLRVNKNSLKIYNKFNFFKHTYCEFKEVSENIFTDNPAHFKSKSDSLYHYTDKGVYRYSDHWGRVANCRWKLLANDDFKNQEKHLGYANWVDFYHLNDHERLFYITVDHQQRKVNFNYKDIDNPNQLFTALEAQKRVKQIRELFNNDRWAKYYVQDIETLRYDIIEELIATNKNLQQLKLAYK